MKRAAAFILIIFSLCPGLPAQTTRPIPQISKIVIISVDGLRPDLALRASTPNIHALMNIGSYTFWARTTAESITLPSHTSMLTGVTPVKHGIQWNSDLPLKHPVYPMFPTIFELAHQAGYTTAMAAGKSKFINLAKPGTLNWLYIPASQKDEDLNVAAQAVAIILAHQPDLLFIHFPSVDAAGHAYGWASSQQLDAIAEADESIGLILWALDERHLRQSTFILVTADHGGAGLSHGPDDPRSRNIPWLTAGPKIRRALDLTTYPDLIINTEDTFSTAAYLLGIPILKKVDGKPVLEIFDRSNQQLLHPAPQ
jgi:predicted AlkP superfamily pyrophosphatase or phosphodiesterase